MMLYYNSISPYLEHVINMLISVNIIANIIISTNILKLINIY